MRRAGSGSHPHSRNFPYVPTEAEIRAFCNAVWKAGRPRCHRDQDPALHRRPGRRARPDRDRRRRRTAGPSRETSSSRAPQALRSGNDGPSPAGWSGSARPPRWAGLVSGLVARIVKRWPNRTWPAGQGTGQGLTRARRPGPGPDPEGQCQPAVDRRGPAAITSGQETKQYRTPPWPGRAQPERARREAYRAGGDATGRTGTPKEKEKRS